MPLGFNSIPPELKIVTPYVQRAEEVKTAEPVVAYWCTYYAAQLGISVGAKESKSRAFLAEFLGLLENMKNNITQNDETSRDVLDDEIASSAYVESFALKIFNLADNEDRVGKATRGTAQKFLASANFLEVLKVFDQTELTESHADKIRYAKWKATDIAKAVREGRTPTPGPASGLEAEDLSLPTLSELAPPSDGLGPPQQLLGLPPPKHDLGGSPGDWSNAATPGIDTPQPQIEPGATGDPILRQHDFDAGLEDDSFVDSQINNEYAQPGASPSPTVEQFQPIPPPGPFDPSVSPPQLAETPPSLSNSLIPSSPPSRVDPIQEHLNQHPTATSHASFPGAMTSHNSAHPPSAMTATVTAMPELTPQLIAKIQKHCRYAASALDYEDAKQARKELTTALSLLGGE